MKLRTTIDVSSSRNTKNTSAEGGEGSDGPDTPSAVVKRAMDCGTSATPKPATIRLGIDSGVDDLLGYPRQKAGIDTAFLDVACELRAIGVEDDVILRRQFVKRNALAPGQRVRVRQCEDHLFPPSKLAGQAVFGRNAANKTNVGRAVEECCDLQCRRLLMHRGFHRWSNLSVGGKQFRQPTAQDGAGRTNVKRADKAGDDPLKSSRLPRA